MVLITFLENGDHEANDAAGRHFQRFQQQLAAVGVIFSWSTCSNVYLIILTCFAHIFLRKPPQQGRFLFIFIVHVGFDADLINCFVIYYSQQHSYPKDIGANLFSPVHLEVSTSHFSLSAPYVPSRCRQ